VLAVLCGLLALAAVAWAAFPQDPPNDPGYAPAEGTPDKCLTKSADEQQHYLFSFMPQCTQLTATDPENAAGMSVDSAWRDFTPGRGDTVIAYVEGGINWHYGDAEELANRVFLNKGELPAPTTDNGDGTLSALDFADTPDANKNGVVDPEDIIVRFSDGKDDDGNGYVDDISGWDFYDDQNDPATVDSAYGHANWQQKQAAAEGNNGVGEIGVCPRCMIMPVKAGAEALDRTDDLAQAWLYAADMKADVIVSVTADLGYSTFMRQAVEDIWKRGVVMVEASNDFDSLDHQGGMFWPHVLPGNGMVANSHGVAGPAANALTKTYRVRSGLTSWGTHNMFTAATTGGSTSESTPTVGGVMALVLAYGKDAAEQGKIARPLTNAEAVQVVRATASDQDDPNDAWPTKPGWDLQYGYGRPNVHKAMEAVSKGDIPPVAWLESPDWFALYDPAKTKSVPVTGHVDAPRSSGYTWKLEFAPGAEPSDGDFIEAGSGTGSAPLDGSLGSIDLSKIPQSFWDKPFEQSKTKVLETNEQYTVTLRVRVTDANGRVGEERRSIAVHHDPALMKGYPKRIGPSIEGEPVLADLQGKGRLAAIFADADGKVHALDGRSGRELKGWPAKLNRTVVTKAHAGIDQGREPVVSNPAVGDLDHNGRLSVVVTSTTGRVYVFKANGKRRRGWPKRMSTGVSKPAIPRPEMPFTRLPQQGASSPPLLQDMNGDKKLEIVQGGWNGRLYVWRPSGRRAAGWPVEVKLPDDHHPPQGNFVVQDHKLTTAPAVADLDGDGKPELVVRSQYTDIPMGGVTPGGVAHLHAYHADGTPVTGFPVEMQGLVEYYGSAQEFITEGTHAPSAADVDGDGNDEVAASPIFTPPSLFDGDGSRITAYGSANDAVKTFLTVQGNPAGVVNGDLPSDEPVTFTTSGAFGKLGGNLVYAQPQTGSASIAASLVAAGSGFGIKNYLTANDAKSGAPVQGFPAEIQGLNFLGAPLIADVSGDGQPDAITGADSSAMHAFDASGAQVDGFPKFTTGWTVWAPSTGDLLSDGKTDLVSSTREGYVMAWKTPGRASANGEWWSYRHDERNTARYGVDTRPPGAVRKLKLSRRGKVTFRAPGDDWYEGHAKSYRVKYRTKRGKTRTKTVKAKAGAGKRVSIKLPAGTRRVTVQAVDDAGNLGTPVSAVKHR
jgi:FG-GAP-like repeat/Subtilase family